jgi:hypothetical protein
MGNLSEMQKEWLWESGDRIIGPSGHQVIGKQNLYRGPWEKMPAAKTQKLIANG